MNALYNTCKQQIGIPSNIYDLGQITCRTIQACSEEVNPTVAKIQDLILNPSRNLLKIYDFQKDLFKLWELPSFSQGLQAVKSSCNALPIFSAIDLIGFTSLQYVPYVKISANFIQSSYALKSSIEAILPSANIDQTNELNKKNTIIRNLIDSLKTIDGSLQREKDSSSKQTELYEACRALEKAIPQISESADSKRSKDLGMLHRMILNSENINENFSSFEISKFKEILDQTIEKGDGLVGLNVIPDQFKAHLDKVVKVSDTKSLLEVLKCAINWILGASGMISLFLIGAAIPATALLSLEVCSFIVRLAISFYKNYLASICTI